MPAIKSGRLRTYDSGWFAAAAGTTYTLTHNLGSELLNTCVLFRTGVGAAPSLVTLAGGGSNAMRYVDRGDLAATDYTQAAFTQDNTWRDLDISAIVGAKSALVHLRVTITDSATETLMRFRENGNANVPNSTRLGTQVINISKSGDCFVMTDSAGVLEYLVSSACNAISVSVAGWFETVTDVRNGCTVQAMSTTQLTVQTAATYVAETLTAAGLVTQHAAGQYRVLAGPLTGSAGISSLVTTAWSRDFVANATATAALGDLGIPFYNTSDYGNDIDALVAAAGAGPYIINVNSDSTVSVNTTTGAGIHFVFQPGCVVTVNNTITLTIASPAHVHCPMRDQAFAWVGSGTVAFTAGGVLYPGWWGAVADGATDDQPAIQACVRAAHNGDEIFFPSGDYAIANTVEIGSWSIDPGTGNVLGFSFAKQGLRVHGGGDPKQQTARIFWTGAAQTGLNTAVLNDSVGPYTVYTDTKPMFRFLGCSNLTLARMVFDGDGKAWVGVEYDGNYSYVDASQVECRECYIGMRNTRHYNVLTWGAAWDYSGSPWFKANVYDPSAFGGYQSDSHHYVACQFNTCAIGYSCESQQALALEFHQCGFSGNTTAHVHNSGGRIDFFGCWSSGTPTNEFLHVASTCWLSFHEYHTESVPTNAGFQSSTTIGANPVLSISHSEFKAILISSGGVCLTAVNSALTLVQRVFDGDQLFKVTLAGTSISSIMLCATAFPAKVVVSGATVEVTGGGALLQGAGAYQCDHWFGAVYPASAYPYTPGRMAAATHDYAAGVVAWTMTAAEALATDFTTSNASGAVDAIFPAVQPGKIFAFANNTGQVQTVKVTGQAGITIATGKTAVCRFGTADVVEIYEQP